MLQYDISCVIINSVDIQIVMLAIVVKRGGADFPKKSRNETLTDSRISDIIQLYGGGLFCGY